MSTSQYYIVSCNKCRESYLLPAIAGNFMKSRGLTLKQLVNLRFLACKSINCRSGYLAVFPVVGEPVFYVKETKDG